MLGPPSDADAPTTIEPAPSLETHGQLEVRVRVRGRRDAVAGARLIADTDASDPEAIAIETDDRGVARLWLMPGVHHIHVRADGYERHEFEITIAAGEQRELEVRIHEAVGGNRFRTVVGSEPAVAVSRTTLRDEEIHEL